MSISAAGLASGDNSNINAVLPSSTYSSSFNSIDRSALPPMLRQYVDYKEKHPECVIFCQVGDFYEVFFDDAVVVAKSLNLTLTSRDKSSDSPIPMCGVPISSLDGYIERLVEIGISVAVVSQVNAASFARLPSAYKEENAKEKITITRELTRIVTPGVRLLGETGSARQQAFVMSVSFGDRERAAICYSDPQSGTLYVKSSLAVSELSDEVGRVAPIELILPRQLEGQRLDGRSALVRTLQKSYSNLNIKYREPGTLRIGASYSRDFNAIEGFASLELESKQAVMLWLDYVDETTIGAQIGFNKIVSDENDETMVIGATTRTNLELLASPTAGAQAGLLNAIDLTKSAGGARLLRSWLLRPLKKISLILQRYEVVDFFINDFMLRSNVRKKLELAPDLERIAARIELQCVSPRELGALRDLSIALKGNSIIDAEVILASEQVQQGNLKLLACILNRLRLPEALSSLLSESLQEELPAQLSEGFIIKEGFNEELDTLRGYQQEGRTWVQEFERREQQRSGIPTLKVKFNYVLGFFIEVTKSHLAKVPADYEKRQGTVSSERFVTQELKERERGVLGADEKAIALERKLFFELRKELLGFCRQIRVCAEALSELDVLSSFSELAEAESYVRPEIDNGTGLVMENGRHPVVQKLMRSGFVPNSLSLGEKDSIGDHVRKISPNALILTGPNMGGKSTFLRQAGILTIMAQMGSYVPADRFSLGLVDQIFARIGASDNIAGGESTFMVEMREVVQIISASTERSLILIDEVGRGTATGDGAALAQAIIEWLVRERKCRILFATHFHNLTDLPKQDPDLGNICVAAIESNGEIIFTHQIKSGAAGHSYGLEVAKLAGVPAEIIRRSSELVAQALSDKCSSGKSQIALPFSEKKIIEPQIPEDYQSLVRIRGKISSINLNNITPLEALGILNELQKDME